MANGSRKTTTRRKKADGGKVSAATPTPPASDTGMPGLTPENGAKSANGTTGRSSSKARRTRVVESTPTPSPAEPGGAGGESFDETGEPPERPNFYPEAAEQLDAVLSALDDDDDHIIGWAQDRIDPDAMAAAGLFYLLLKRKYGKRFTCYTSRRMTFPMNRNLAKNFLPAGLLRRCEHEENLKEIALGSPLIIVLDASNLEVMTDFNRLIQGSEDLRAKQLFFIDHHRRAAEGDVESLENAAGIRIEHAQSATAILVHLLLSMGIELDPSNEEEFKLAVAAKVGIEIDAIGQPQSELNEAARSALEYLDEVVGDEGRQLVAKLRMLKYPVAWYTSLGNAVRLCEEYDQNCAICGLGVIDDNGVLPYVANSLMDTGQFKSVIVFAIVYDSDGGNFLNVDLEASGRSQRNTEIALPELFGEVFYWIDPDGRRISCGGGRASSVLGEHSSTGASVPLPYWLYYPALSLEEKVDVLRRFAWPAEYLRIRNLLAPRVGIKPEKIFSVYPMPNGMGHGHGH